jgi:cytochrome c-type biogenesis protein CcmH
LRCLVCQNQSIDDSDAPLARDLRLLVRERLQVGDSDDQVIDFVVSRYGEFVLLKPRLRSHTWLLWFATPVLFLLAMLLIFLSYRRRSRVPRTKAEAPLTRAEEAKLNKLLDRG